MSNKQFPAVFNLLKKFEGKKPPVVPWSFELLTTEIQERIDANIVNIMPSTMYCLLHHTILALYDEKNVRLQELLSMAISEKKPTDERMKMIQRIDVCGKFTTSEILASLFEVYKRCEGGIHFTFQYPIDAWIIIGPPRAMTEWNNNTSRVCKDLDIALSDFCKEDPIRKDFFCFNMQFLSLLVQKAIDDNRSKSIIAQQICRIISLLLANRLIKVQCSACQSYLRTKKRSTTCNSCSDVFKFCQNDIVENCMQCLLQYVPSVFWINAMSNPRISSFIRRDVHEVKKSLLEAYKLSSK